VAVFLYLPKGERYSRAKQYGGMPMATNFLRHLFAETREGKLKVYTESYTLKQYDLICELLTDSYEVQKQYITGGCSFAKVVKDLAFRKEIEFASPHEIKYMQERFRYAHRYFQEDDPEKAQKMLRNSGGEKKESEVLRLLVYAFGIRTKEQFTLLQDRHQSKKISTSDDPWNVMPWNRKAKEEQLKAFYEQEIARLRVELSSAQTGVRLAEAAALSEKLGYHRC